MADRDISRSLQTLFPATNGTMTGKLGYQIKGAFRVYVVKKPSMFYVRFTDGSFVEAKHDGKVKAKPGLQVDLYVDERNVFHISGINQSEEDAYVETYGTGLYVPDHTHSLDDMDWITVKSASIGKVLYGNGTGYDAVLLSDYAITHAAITGTGVILKTGAETYITFKVNQNGSGIPTVDDDISLGYEQGLSWWRFGNDFYDLVDDTNGAAVWKLRGDSTGKKYRQFVYDVVAGDLVFATDEDGFPVFELMDLE